MKLLSGIEASSHYTTILKEKIKASGIQPCLTIVLVGDDKPSHLYVKNKIKKAGEIGIKTNLIHLPANTTPDTMLNLIKSLNEDPQIHGYILQMPLPPHLQNSRHLINNLIAPEKDVDGFSSRNMGALIKGEAGFIPATPLGILLLLAYYSISVEGKHVVVVGRSTTVGMPLSILLASKSPFGNATVTICHSHTPNLEKFIKEAHILITAMGKPHAISTGILKKGTIVIDVGINFKDGKIVGDCLIDTSSNNVEAITPVPGGVGPMTVFALMLNTWASAYYKTIKRELPPPLYFTQILNSY